MERLADGTLGNRFNYTNITLEHEFLWRYTKSRDFVAGDYLWTGIDYLGETYWPNRNASFSPIDTAGFCKDTYYYFRSIWNEEDTTLHILPHWNHKGKEGEFIPIIGYTNCEYVELYLNGRLIGIRGYDCPNLGALTAWNEKAKDTSPTTHDLHLCWDAPYEQGELLAVGYIGGREVKRVCVNTTGEAAKLVAKADRTTATPGGIVQIELSAQDQDGRFVPDADQMVRVKVTGDACLLGMDNGNRKDLTDFTSNERAFFSGKLLCVVRAGKEGNAKVLFSSDGMEGVEVDLDVCAR
jgi:beta-galactosidase